MSFSNRMAGVKDQIAETERERTARNVAEDRFIAIDCGLWSSTRRERLACGRRRGQWRRLGQRLWHFGDAHVSREAHHVQPVHNYKIRECDESDAGNHESPRSDLDEGKRHGDHRRGDAKGDEMRQPSPGAHSKYWSRALAGKNNGCGESTQCVLAVADSEYA